MDLIRDPEPYDEKHVMIEEFEVEGAALEEFLLSLGDFSDIVRAKTDRWKNLLNAFQKQLTNNEDIETCQKKLGEQVEFWDGVKSSNPVQQLNNMLAAGDQSSRFLEFACKCIRRAMEDPQFTTDQIIEALAKIKFDEATEDLIKELIDSRIRNLDEDIVIKQRERFQQLEEKVKIMLEQKALNGGNNQITPAQLQKILYATKSASGSDADLGSRQVVSFENEKVEV